MKNNSLNFNKNIPLTLMLKGIYMLKKLPQLKEALVPSSANPIEAVDYITSYMDTHYCENINIDISFMNIMDACYVSTLCSTKHFTKYPNGKLNWKVSSNKVEELNKALELGNNSYIL